MLSDVSLAAFFDKKKSANFGRRPASGLQFGVCGYSIRSPEVSRESILNAVGGGHCREDVE